MKFRVQIRLRYFRAGIILSLLPTVLLLTGCIRDERGDCARTTVIYITVAAGIEGGSPPVGGATVYLFDPDKLYVTQVAVSREQIEAHTPIAVPVSGRGNRAVVWGNTGGSEVLTGVEHGIPMSDMTVALRRDAEGYAMQPGDLYYGIVELTGEDGQTVVISPKTARVGLTVKGLPGDARAEDYYFTMETYYDAYDFAGAPLAGNAEMKFTGVFDSRHDLVTPQPQRAVHYPQQAARNGATQQYAVVNLWKKDGELLASANKDINGMPLRPQAGKTTNILLDFTQTGGLRVAVVITDWDEIWQWEEW